MTPRFRRRLTPPLAVLPDLLTVGQLIDELLQPGHFFVAPSLQLHWNAATAEDVPWEIFRGRLVDPAHTRHRARLLSWHITEASGGPLISVRLDVHAGVVHVTRGILCYVWEGYDAGDNVIQSREVQRWTTELVGSAELARFSDLDELRDELVCLLWQAVVGTSRLPLHSVEAPLPAFSIGQLHYCYRPWAVDVAEPMRDWRTLLTPFMRPECARAERVKLLEAVLRHVERDEIIVIRQFMTTPGINVGTMLLAVFNAVSLSPYTKFADNAILLGCVLSLWGTGNFFSHLLCQLSRHLTAYDLVRFHHSGANYPDALLIDATLKAYLAWLDQAPTALVGPGLMRQYWRRALRQASLVRRHYEGHPVPDYPTSPGENARVLPPPHDRVAVEQLTQPHRRERRLFEGAQLRAEQLSHPIHAALSNAIADLSRSEELRELGLGLFIDRPLGYAKQPGEPDYTPLLAHEAFSPSIARQRLKELALLAQELALDLPADFFPSIERLLQEMPVRGVPAPQLAEPARPTTALADVRRVADDFVIVRTMPGGLGEMLAFLELPPLPKPHVVAMIQSPRGPVLTFFDADYHVMLEAVVDASAGFVRRAGVELPVAGVRVVSA